MVAGAALGATEKVAVIWEELTTTTLLTEMEGPALMTRPVEKLEPLRVTGREAPGEAEAGEREEREGAG